MEAGNLLVAVAAIEVMADGLLLRIIVFRKDKPFFFFSFLLLVYTE